MDLLEYQELALRTASVTRATDGIKSVLNATALGLTGESGEVADTVKKILFHGHPLDSNAVDAITKELGDVLWYLALGCNALGTTLEEVAQLNVAKLRERYPEGFDPEKSLFRGSETGRFQTKEPNISNTPKTDKPVFDRDKLQHAIDKVVPDDVKVNWGEIDKGEIGL